MPGTQSYRQAPVEGVDPVHSAENIKHTARWKLHQARDQIRQGHFDAAEKLANEAEKLEVKWGYFDDTPAKTKESIAKARAKPKAAEPAKVATAAPEKQIRDRYAARTKLQEARAALAANQIDKAEAIARDLQSWNLHFGLFEDTPNKLATAVTEARRRDAVRNAELMVRSYVGTPDGARGEPVVPASAEAPNADATLSPRARRLKRGRRLTGPAPSPIIPCVACAVMREEES